MSRNYVLLLEVEEIRSILEGYAYGDGNRCRLVAALRYTGYLDVCKKDGRLPEYDLSYFGCRIDEQVAALQARLEEIRNDPDYREPESYDE
jgi:hypothetical protein